MQIIKKIYKLIILITVEIREMIEAMVISWPGKIGVVIRNRYWSRKFHSCISFHLGTGCVIKSPENIIIGERLNLIGNIYLYAHNSGKILIANGVSINTNVIIGAADHGEIIIGNNVLIGPNVVFRASNHKYKRKDITIYEQGHTGGRIIIEDDVWIGSNVVVLPNVKIGKGSIIGAGAVVNKDIPPYSLAGGVPCRVIKEDCRV